MFAYLREHTAPFFMPGPVVDGPELAVVENGLLNLPWETKRTARHEYFMSLKPVQYSYGKHNGEDIVYTSNPFDLTVKAFMTALNLALGTRFNACFLNKYDNEQQHLGWHADDFAGMDKSEPIAVVSFGAIREIWVKPQTEACEPCRGRGSMAPLRAICGHCNGTGKQPVKGKVRDEDRYRLTPGSVWIMPIGYQDTHFHRIPKHPQPCGWRISLTFRSFLPTQT